jgi:hypothetical protein
MNGQYMRRRGDDAAMGAEPETATPEDVRVAWQHVVADLGCTFADLRFQASAGNFDSINHRLAWLAFSDLGGFLDD